jgi:hypothetical protein
MAVGISNDPWTVTTCREPQGLTIGSEQARLNRLRRFPTGKFNWAGI